MTDAFRELGLDLAMPARDYIRPYIQQYFGRLVPEDLRSKLCRSEQSVKVLERALQATLQPVLDDFVSDYLQMMLKGKNKHNAYNEAIRPLEIFVKALENDRVEEHWLYKEFEENLRSSLTIH